MSNLTSDLAYHLGCLIRSGRRFSADDVRQRLSRPALAQLRVNPNTIGQIFKTAAEAKQIRVVGYCNASHAKAKGHLVRMWERG